jgi:hypothetical protein
MPETLVRKVTLTDATCQVNARTQNRMARSQELDRAGISFYAASIASGKWGENSSIKPFENVQIPRNGINSPPAASK